MKTVLSIAGADPSGGAGIQADLRTFESLGVRGLSVITALTAQNRREVREVKNISPEFLSSQITTLLEEFIPDAVKVGMLGTSANARALKGIIKDRGLRNVVLDPVIISTSGHPLIDRAGVRALKELLPLAAVVTPNLAEASALTGLSVEDLGGMEEAARKVLALGPGCVLITGGHLKGRPVDLLYDGRRFRSYEGKRLRGPAERFHGTGCVLSAAVAAGLARGLSVAGAVKKAKGLVEATLRKRR